MMNMLASSNHSSKGQNMSGDQSRRWVTPTVIAAVAAVAATWAAGLWLRLADALILDPNGTGTSGIGNVSTMVGGIGLTVLVAVVVAGVVGGALWTRRSAGTTSVVVVAAGSSALAIAMAAGFPIGQALARALVALPVALPVAAAAVSMARGLSTVELAVSPRHRIAPAFLAVALLGATVVVVPTAVSSPAAAANGVCPAGAREVQYDLAAFQTVIPLNGWGDRIMSGLVYALQDDKDAIVANPNLTQPIVIRANVGDCIIVSLRNDISDRRVGIHPDGVVQFDPKVSDGAMVGNNPDTTVGFGEEREYVWYADREGEAPVLDIANLDTAAPGHATVQKGLYGAVIVHPAGSTWHNQITGSDLLVGGEAVESQLFADIRIPEVPDYRSFAMVMMDQNEDIVDRDGLPPTNPKTGFGEDLFGINYRSEPLSNRMRAVKEFRAGQAITLPNGLTYDPNAGDKFCDGWVPEFNDGAGGYTSGDGLAMCIGEEAHLQSWPFGDAGKLTRILDDGTVVTDSDNLIPKAYVGDPVRFSIVHPGAVETHPWHQHAHRWFADPNNPNSPRNDVQSLGPGEGFPLVFEGGAGGLQGTIGDSIFHCHLYAHFAAGFWGNLRTFDRMRDGTVLTDADGGTMLFNGVPSNQYPDGTPIQTLQPLVDRDTPLQIDAEHPGFPLFLKGDVGQRTYRAPHAVVADTFKDGVGTDGLPLRRPGDTVREPTVLEAANLPALDPAKPGAAFIDPCPEGTPMRRYNPQAIDVPIVYNDNGWFDPQGRIYVEGDAGREAVLNNLAPTEPYTTRSRIGECVEMLLTNNLHLDDDPNLPIDVLSKFDGVYQAPHFTSEVSTHVHLVEFDQLGSDGTSVGWNYVQAAMPGQTYGYRWFVDTALRTVFFHDHQYANEHQQKGLFAAMNVQPADATWHDPATGADMTDTDYVRPVADIRSASGADFREFTLFVQDRAPQFKNGVVNYENAIAPPFAPDDYQPDQGGSAYNYRNAPYQIRSKPGVDGPEGDPAYVYSSVVHGDPDTPVFRAYEGDPVIIRTVTGSHEEAHTFTLNGHRWLSEPDNPRSMLTASAGMMLAEWFNFEIRGNRVVRVANDDETVNSEITNGADNGTPIILGDGAGSPGDYLYGSPAIDDQWLGLWGIMRVPGSQLDDLKPLPDRGAPASAASPWPAIQPGSDYSSAVRPEQTPCPAGTPIRRYSVSSVARDIVYNPTTGEHDPYGLKYVLDGVPEQDGPLFLRANAGECVIVDFTNRSGDWQGEHDGDVPMVAEADFPWGLRTGINASLVESVVASGDGAAVGYNFDSTVAPGESIRYRWYAAPELTGLTANLMDFGDRKGHVHHGLFGGLLIEPAGSTWTDPITGEPIVTGDSAVITWTDAQGVTQRLREFVVAYQDGFQMRTAAPESAILPPPYEIETPWDMGSRAINYRTERLRPRALATGPDEPWYAMSSARHGDPATPVFEAHVGDPVQMRVLQSSDRVRVHQFILSGHGWNYQPFDPTSTVRSAIGMLMPGRSFSQWLLGGAGGTSGMTGDFLYRDGNLRNQVDAGLWGILRVLPQGDAAVRPLSEPVVVPVEEELPIEEPPIVEEPDEEPPVDEGPDEEPPADVDDPVVEPVGDAELEFTKELGEGSSTPEVGDTVTYEFEARNRGDVTLTGVSIADNLAGLSALVCDRTLPTVLTADQRVECTADYVVTQADVDAGSIMNIAVAAAQTPGGEVLEEIAGATVTFTPDPRLNLDKVFTGLSDTNSNGRADAGETLVWMVTATNTGNVTLTDVTLTDDLTGGTNSCESIAPGRRCLLETSLTLTQEVIDAGTVSNTADVDAESPAGDDVTAEDSDTQSIEAKPSVTLDKVFTGHDDANDNDRVDAGETYSWTVTATNTGNTTITGLTVTDDLTGQNVTCEVVAPDATCVLEATYVLVQADVDAGSVANTATVSGQTPTGEISGSDTDLVPIAADPSVAVAKSVTTEASCDGSGDFIALPEGGGDVVWCFTITNPGNVTLTGVAIDDDLLDMSPSGAQPAGLPATLAPGETVVVSAGSFVRDTTINTVTAIAGAPAVESEPATAVADVDPDTFGVSGFAFFDRNRDGVQDEGEPLLPGVEVVLEPSDEGEPSDEAEPSDEVEPAELAFASVTAGAAFEPGDRRSPRAVTTTGADGRYTFGAVAVGDYVVRSSMSLRGIVQTSDSDGDLDWSVQLSVVDRPVIAYFAAIGQGTLQGKVYRQVDGLPIANAKLACVWDGPDGSAGTADDVTFESVANAEGNYLIDGLPFGGFACTAVDPVTGNVQPFSATINSEVPVVADVVYPSVVFAQTPSTPKTPSISRPSAPRLPSTGASVLVLLVVAVSMLVGGSALATSSRRRRK